MADHPDHPDLEAVGERCWQAAIATIPETVNGNMLISIFAEMLISAVTVSLGPNPKQDDIVALTRIVSRGLVFAAARP